MDLRRLFVVCILLLQIMSFSTVDLKSQTPVLKGMETKQIEINTLLDSAYYYLNKKIDAPLAKIFALQAIQLSKEENYNYGEGKGNMYVGRYHEYFHEFDKALGFYQKSNAFFIDDKDFGELYTRMGILYGKNGSYTESLKIFKEGLKIQEKAKDTFAIAKSYMNIGNVYNGLEKSTISLESYHTARKLLNKLCQSSCDSTLLVQVKMNIAVANEEKGNLELAEVEYLECLDLLADTGNQSLKAFCLNNLGIVYTKLNEWEKSEKYLNDALTLAKLIEDNDNLVIIYKGLADLEEARGNIKEANTWNKSLYKLTLELSESRSEQFFAEMHTRFELEKKNNKIQMLQESVVQNRKIRWLLAGLLFLGLLVGGISFVYQKKIHEKTRLIQKAKLEVLEKNNKLVEERLNFQNKELVNFAMHLVQKNDFLESIEEKLKNLKDIDASHKKELSAIIFEIKHHQLIGDDLVKFQSRVLEIKADFFALIKTKYPKVTKKETNLAALLSLGLTSTEIASILGVTENAVKISRHRLRKKLDLDSTVNLNNFFYNI